MCTVTIIPLGEPGAGYRLVFNRDEQRSRPEALPPRETPLADGRRVVAPVDPESGGTWIAACSDGLTMAVTNVNPRPAPVLPPREMLRSRGSIIPALIGARGAGEAIREIAGAPLDLFAPFRLLAVEPAGGARCVEAVWDREELRVTHHEGTGLCFASSGLGDERVAERVALYRAEFGAADAAVQDAFHRHVWEGRGEVSVMMSRADARTVSVTTVEVRARGGLFDVRMDYRAVPDHR